jgi:hypothetical protein
MQRWSRWEDVRVLEQRKGGNLPGGELLAKLADQDTDGVVAVSEPLGYFPHGLFFGQDAVNQRQLGASAENPNKSRENRQSGSG